MVNHNNMGDIEIGIYNRDRIYVLLELISKRSELEDIYDAYQLVLKTYDVDKEKILNVKDLGMFEFFTGVWNNPAGYKKVKSINVE